MIFPQRWWFSLNRYLASDCNLSSVGLYLTVGGLFVHHVPIEFGDAAFFNHYGRLDYCTWG